MADIQRFDIPSKPTLIEMFRAFRGFLERSFAAKGEKLDPAWYADSPDERPGLYKDQPHLLTQRETTAMISDPCVVRLLAEGGAIEIFGRQEPDGSWRFVTRVSNLDFTNDGNDTVTVGGLPRCSDLATLLPARWASLTPTKIHPGLRQWFRDHYEDSVAVMPAWQRKSHDQTRGHRWRALFESTPPDRWSEPDDF